LNPLKRQAGEMVDRISVIVVDSQRLFRDALVSALDRGNVIKVSGVADNTGDAVDLVAGGHPDVVVYADGTPGLDLLDALREIRRCSPASHIILLVEDIDDRLALQALEAGASGYVGKDQKLEVLAKAITCVHRGEHWIERRLVSKIIEQGVLASCDNLLHEPELPGELTPREREVLMCLVKGHSNREIGEALYISEKTVKTHLGNIYAKLNITKRVEAILYVAKQFEGLFGAPSK
jgi:DNA-binding NarL/FixJ family response regulator